MKDYILQKELFGKTDADKYISNYISCKKFIEGAEISNKSKEKLIKVLEREVLEGIRQDELKVRLGPPYGGK